MRVCKNNFFLISILVVVVLISMISFVSSNYGMASIGGSRTLVNGIIYYADNDKPVNGADVVVECNHNNGVSKKTEGPVKSESDGSYFVIFNQYYCDEEDIITVTATKGQLTGTNIGVVHDKIVRSLDVAVVNVPLVPEFGIIVGAITILGALGVFFVVRRK